MKQRREHLEELLRRAFCHVLQLDEVGLDDDFFLLGGHSMLVVRLARGLWADDVRIDYEHVFEGRTVRGIVDRLVDRTGVGEPTR